jgi:hypothetical protein
MWSWEMNDYLIATCTVITIVMFMFLAMVHEQDAKTDCIKSTSKQCYTVDEIYKLCGVEK